MENQSTVETPFEYPAVDETYARPVTRDQLDRAAKALTERLVHTYVVPTVAEARRLLGELLPTDQEIFTASSQTLTTSGIAADIDESGRFRSLRARLSGIDDVVAQIREGAAPDVVVGSVHAVTGDGHLVVTSASGSQLAAYAAGARKAFWVVGAQKVVPDLDSALRRIRTYSLP
ncbi:MAG TPA: LUD domain-containing protein, partial [Actinopolymorphaceae bacterium]